MNRKELLVVNVIILVLVVSFGWIAFRLSINQNPFAAPTSETSSQATKQANTNCSKQAPLAFSPAADPNLERLAAYQDVCKSFVTNKLMVFTAFSQDRASAAANATSMAAKLKLFYQAHVTPLVVVEPYISDQAMSYDSYLAGDYDDGMAYYFAMLKQDGVTDAMMGTWVPFPESNTPSWNNKDTEPHDFALCVNKYLALLKQYFPNAQGSILLDATTYDPNDVNWENGDYISLSPYVDAIDHNLVTSVGIEGFPWISNAQQPRRTIFSASEYLQPDLAIGMAQVLRTRDIWVNTGTFASKYTNDPNKRVTISVTQRKALLDDILQTVLNMRDYQENQYRVSINLFSEDKSNTTEATDWSYFQDSDSQAILKQFLTDAASDDIPVSISDKTN